MQRITMRKCWLSISHSNIVVRRRMKVGRMKKKRLQHVINVYGSKTIYSWIQYKKSLDNLQAQNNNISLPLYGIGNSWPTTIRMFNIRICILQKYKCSCLKWVRGFFGDVFCKNTKGELRKCSCKFASPRVEGGIHYAFL